MARLNEPATESLDTLKRRFLRQNRDLARSNSIQSLKIRSLESEIAQLLSENASLHQTIISLSTELEDVRNRDSSSPDVSKIWRQLDAKAKEFDMLVQGLGEISKAQKRKDTRRKSQLLEQGRVAVARRSPEQKQWRNERSLSEVLQAQKEAAMPTINEDKHYPRRTMDAGEMSRLLSDANSDSPDIGPPPRTSLFDSDQDRGSSQELAGSAIGGLLSANFETRRRRRETRVRADEESNVATSEQSEAGAGIEETKTASGQPVNTIVRTGAKRKLDWQKAVEVTVENGPASPKNPATRSSMNASGIENANPNANANGSPPERKVLASKAVNTDPVVSPRKNVPAKERDKDKPLPRNPPVSRNSKENKSSLFSIPPPASVAQTVELPLEPIKKEPKTPHGLDICSPASTQPSGEGRNETRDTPPPPSDIGATRSGTASNSSDGQRQGRGSLRARAPVSYTEPSLNTKMRRPGKEMAPAVVNGGRRSVSAQPEDQNQSQDEVRDTSAVRTVHLKDEAKDAAQPEKTVVGFPNWSRPASPSTKESKRPEPGSPLGEKDSAVSHTHSSTATSTAATTDRRRSILNSRHHQPRPTSNSESRSSSNHEKAETNGQHDIFDFQPSSPPPDSKAPKPPAKDTAPLPSRPKSTVTLSSTSSSAASRPTSSSGRSAQDASSTATKTGSLRRRQTLSAGANVSTTLNGSAANIAAKPRPNLQRSRSSVTLGSVSRPSSREGERDLKDIGRMGNTGEGTSTVAAEREKRIAARRRSMML